MQLSLLLLLPSFPGADDKAVSSQKPAPETQVLAWEPALPRATGMTLGK